MIDEDKLRRLEKVTVALREAFSRFQQSVELLAQVQNHLNKTLQDVRVYGEPIWLQEARRTQLFTPHYPPPAEPRHTPVETTCPNSTSGQHVYNDAGFCGCGANRMDFDPIFDLNSLAAPLPIDVSEDPLIPLGVRPISVTHCQHPTCRRLLTADIARCPHGYCKACCRAGVCGDCNLLLQRADRLPTEAEDRELRERLAEEEDPCKTR